MTRPTRTVPPWQIVVPVLLFGAIVVFVVVVVVAALAGGDFSTRGLLPSAAVVAVATGISIGLLRRWRIARFVGFLAGVALVVLGLYIYSLDSTWLELVVGLGIAIPLASRPAERWTRGE
ncbi:hypothetical protein AB0M54_15520 [Actinoplanes sp. NPDC051470]|uniref:hypothetical protein n=1 Tax=Actinoplanes sp. NPDC051470 TaxID=3157224 RepID=UPI0034356E5E